jgi:hypothetical protein
MNIDRVFGAMVIVFLLLLADVAWEIRKWMKQ